MCYISVPMKVIPARYAAQLFAILRIMAGLMFMMHGTAKLFAWPNGRGPVDLASRAGIAGLIETIGGEFIVIGLFTSVAAFLCSGLMAFAYFLSHASGGFFPLVNKGELAVVYCFLFLFMSAYGPGAWSVDGMRGRR
jgi:putative oxidoreductase